MTEVLVFVIFFFAMFTQSLTGFGSALLAMPLLGQLFGIRVASPLFVLGVMTAEIIMVTRYRQSFRWKSVWLLMVASVLGIQIGVPLVNVIEERILLLILGLIVFGYALYALIRPRLPKLEGRRWALGIGFIAGILSGAYNAGGPPFVIYGASQQWPPAEFKVNLQTIFLVNTTFILIAHSLNGRMTGQVFTLYLAALPGVLLGLFLGFALDRYINPILFHKVVLFLLLALGLSLIF